LNFSDFQLLFAQVTAISAIKPSSLSARSRGGTEFKCWVRKQTVTETMKKKKEEEA